MSRRIQRYFVVGLFASVALGSTACGDDLGAGALTSDKADGGGDEKDTGIADDTAAGEDTTTTDTATPDDAGADTTAPDAGTDSGIVEPACPGGAGCECATDGDCYSDFCIEVGTKKVCANKCADGCTGDEICVKKSGTEICVPKFDLMCNPCKDNKECRGDGGTENACVDRGNDGFFCGTVCKTSTDCAKGYVCEDAKDVDGTAVRQCVPPIGEVCACTEAAEKAELSTYCKAQSDAGGYCTGERKCLLKGAPGAPADGGLTACAAPPPATETCDGIDNDCDGTPDEGTCDDNNACTADSCKGKGGCQHLGDSGKACDADGSVCTEDDICKDGVCKAGAAKSCDDSNPCTDDLCDPTKGCTTTPNDGGTCNADDNPCTQLDICKAGACVAGEKKNCDSGEACTIGTCDVGTGACKYAAATDIPCNDGNPCTESEICAGEICKGKLVNCDDASTCTSDSCNPTTGCEHKQVSGPCDDSDKCTEKDACTDGACVGLPIGVTAACDDNNFCTLDTCKSAEGCFHKQLDGTGCSDGEACTVGDTCKLGTCAAGNNECGCKVDADCTSKEDGNACNGTLYCEPASKTCKVKPGTAIKCDTSIDSECQANECDPKSGTCGINKGKDGIPCNADSNVCTKDDTCKGGKCETGAVVTCDDSNGCTTDVCDKDGGCEFTANSAPCDADGSKCTSGDQCASGACVPGKMKQCDDGEECTKDVCRATDAVCLSQPLTNTCDDDNKCTLQERCGKHPVTLAWTCVTDKVLICNDGNACTADKCDAKEGCVSTPVPDGGSCDDGNKCTNGDTCKTGTCTGTAFEAKTQCDDFNLCTDDVCSPDKGCLNNPTATKACSDGDDCTAGDQCKEGKCDGGSNTCGCLTDTDCKSKDDGNACNGVLYCDKKTNKCIVNPGTVVNCDISINNACQSNVCDEKDGKCHVNKKKDATPCQSDNNVCTGQDACADGDCVPGTLIDCNDKNACTTDSCDPKGGCVNTPAAGSCDDGNECTTADTCGGGNCKGKDIDVKAVCTDSNECTNDSCDKLKGCQHENVNNDNKCDDGSQCTVSDTCQNGVCKGGTNVCACSVDSDCKDKEDGNACNGTLFCDKSGGVSQCKVNPTTIVSCDTSTDNFCKKTACNTQNGKCEADLKADKTACDADGSVCSAGDTCQAGKCAAGPQLPCEDNSVCTIDSCDPKTGCVHQAKAGGCDADGDACTVDDACAAGVCKVGKTKDCSDGTACTDDSCNKADGKCVYKNVVTSCDDGSKCTVGDKCGVDKSSAYTCLSGALLDCDDTNPCTVDSCDKDKGCTHTINDSITVACFSGDPKNRGVGICADGKQKCKADGTLDKCVGSTLPAPGKELCDSKDNNCDGTTDEGCAPTGFHARIGNAVLDGKGGKFAVRAFAGGSATSASIDVASGNKYGAELGFYAWLTKWLSK